MTTWHEILTGFLSVALVLLLSAVLFSLGAAKKRRPEKNAALDAARILAGEINDSLVKINDDRRDTVYIRPSAELFRGKWMRMVLVVGVFGSEQEAQLVYESVLRKSTVFFEQHPEVRKRLLRIEMKITLNEEDLEKI
jgi:hypothetical protein